MHFILALMRHETNTFSPIPTTLEDLGSIAVCGGQSGREVALRAYRNTNNPISAFVDICEQERADFTIVTVANAQPSGPVDQDAFEAMSNAICSEVSKGCDGIMLDLHGAMVTTKLDSNSGLPNLSTC